jgi:hypothetical protein
MAHAGAGGGDGGGGTPFWPLHAGPEVSRRRCPAAVLLADHARALRLTVPPCRRLHSPRLWAAITAALLCAALMVAHPMESHPESAGTPYEVQLGLLGDDALRHRGWLA